MTKLFNEFGLSLVRAGSWIGASHELEFPDGTETRSLGWQGFPLRNLRAAYVRIWVGKKVLVLATNRPFVKVTKKNKLALKVVFGLQIEK